MSRRLAYAIAASVISYPIVQVIAGTVMTAAGIAAVLTSEGNENAMVVKPVAGGFQGAACRSPGEMPPGGPRFVFRGDDALVNAKNLRYYPENANGNGFGMSDPISRILKAYPAEFFRQTLEHADAGFAEAHTLASRHSEEPERANMLGQLRHARCEAGFRQAARTNGLSVVAPHTKPAGGRYSLVKGDGVYLIRSNIQTHCGPPRPTAFRRQWATLNAWLSPVQLDLLQEVASPSADRLCGMLVITAHPRRGEPSVPSFVGLGIPRPDLSDWMHLIAVNDLLALYHDADAVARKPMEAPIDIKDKAVPRLKKRSDGEG